MTVSSSSTPGGRRHLRSHVVLAALVAAVLFWTDAPAIARTPTWTTVGGWSLIDVPRSSGVTVDAVPARRGLQTLAVVQTNTATARLRVATVRGRVLAEGPTGGAAPRSVLNAGWRLFVTGTAPRGARLWTPAFDPARTLTSAEPALPCRTPRSATTPLAGPFDVTVPAGARPGGSTVPNPTGALVFGRPGGGVRIATPSGITLGGLGGTRVVARGGFGFAGAAFAYGTADGRPVLWTPRLVGTSDGLVPASFATCTSPPASFDGTATPVLAPSGAATARIGRAGGVLTAGGLTLTVPAGALSEDVAVTMTPLADLADSPVAGTVIGGARLTPEGLRFLRPARLTMALPATVRAADVLGFGSAADGSDTHLSPATAVGGQVALDVWHFSTAGAASGGSAAAAAMSTYTPSTAENRAVQRIAAAAIRCAAEQAAGAAGPACAAFDGEAADALADWYAESLSSGLVTALGAPAAQVEAAAAEWLSWAGTVAQLALGDAAPLPAQLAQARSAAAAALADLGARRLDECTGGTLAALESQLQNVSRVADIGAAGGLEPADLGLPADLAAACAHLRIDVLDFPPVAAVSDANTLRGQVVLDVFDGPDQTDVPFTLTVGGAPVTPAATGTFTTTVTATADPLSVDLVAQPVDASLGLRTTRTLQAPARNRLDLVAAGPPTTGVSGTVPLLVRVAGDGMVGADVDLSVTGPGSIPSSVTTDAAGEAAVEFAAGQPATTETATVTATLGGTTATLTVTVTVPVQVRVTPSSRSVLPGGTLQFSATVTGASDTAVSWSATGGAISLTGLYTAGNAPGEFTVTATNPATGVSASVPVRIETGQVLSGAVTQQYLGSPGPSDGFSGFVRVLVRPDGSVTVLDAAGSGTATGFHQCGSSTIVTTLDGGGRYLPAPNAYGAVDVIELRGSETSTIWSFDENGACQSDTTVEDGIPVVEALYARKVVENGTVVAITFELEPPYDYQTGQLLPE